MRGPVEQDVDDVAPGAHGLADPLDHHLVQLLVELYHQARVNVLDVGVEVVGGAFRYAGMLGDVAEADLVHVARLQQGACRIEQLLAPRDAAGAKSTFAGGEQRHAPDHLR